LFQHRRRLLAPALALASAAFVSLPLLAQSGTDTSATPSADTAQAQNATALSQADQIPEQSQQQRAQVLRDAQARVMARRRIREQQVVQDTYSHKYEVYGGGGFLRFRPGPNLQHNTNAAWNAGLTDWVRPKLGVTADFRGYYGTAITDNFTYQIYKPAISQYTFMLGPQYRFYQSLHWDWNAQVLAGLAHGNFGTGIGTFTASDVGLYSDANKLAVSVGAAVDYNLSPVFALRLMPNYLLTTYGGDAQHNLGFTAGVVYRWGRQ
jgi:hypothetical protein